MNKYLLLLSLFFTTLTASAGTFGYTNGTCGRNNVARVGTTSLQGQVIRLDSEKVKMLAGKTITGAQAVLGSRNGSNLHVFVSDNLDGEVLAETGATTVSKTNQWTDFPFTSSYVVKGTEEVLYVGLIYEISPNYSPLSYDFTQDSKGISFAYEEENWVDTYGTGFGMPNIRLVTSEDLNISDLMVKTFTPMGFMQIGNDYSDMEAQVLNIGSTAVKSFKAKVKIGNSDETVKEYNDVNIEPNQIFGIKLPKLIATEKGSQDFHLTLSDVVFANGATEDADPSDNSCSAEVFVYAEDVVKKILLETFTGQHCSNCPNGHRATHEALAALREAGADVVEISHHAGYQADNFTMNEDGEYCFFYNNAGSTYAPAVMVNRWKNPQSTYPGPVFNTGTSLIIENCVALMNQEPFVTIDINSDYDFATREAKVNVDIHCHRKPAGTTVFNVMIAQDSIRTYQTAGGVDYLHNGVCRGTINNNAWGYNITNKLVEGETYSFSIPYTLPEAIESTAGVKMTLPLQVPTDAKNMRFVAYVAAYDESNPNANEVYNCAETPLVDSALGISPIMQNAGSRMQNSYNLAGQKVDNNYRGIVIKNGKKVMHP